MTPEERALLRQDERLLLSELELHPEGTSHPDTMLWLLSRLAAARAGERWVRCSERQPELSTSYMVCNEIGCVCPGYYGRDKVWRGRGLDVFDPQPTYWMPLPSAPMAELFPVAESETK